MRSPGPRRVHTVPKPSAETLKYHLVIDFDGGRTQARTVDPLIKSRVICHFSSYQQRSYTTHNL